MATQDYYIDENPECLTYLEFGSINRVSPEKHIWDFRLHQEAYDFFMLARYMKDLIWYQKLARRASSASLREQGKLYQKHIYTQDLFLSIHKLAALHVLWNRKSGIGEPPRYFELGSTLMGCIEALEYLRGLGSFLDSSFSALNLKKISYHGVDVSDLLNEVAVAVHPSYDVRVSVRDDSKREYDLLFSKGVSLLYAIPAPEQLFALLDRATLSFFDYSFALGESFETNLGTGKKVTYCSLDEFLAAQEGSEKELLIQRSTAIWNRDPNRLRCYCYFGETDLLSEVIREDYRMRRILVERMAEGTRQALFAFRSLSKDPRVYESDFVPVEQLVRERMTQP